MLQANVLTMNGGRDEQSQLGDLHLRKGVRWGRISFTLTVKGGGVTLFGPTATVEPAGGGIVYSKA